MFRVIAYLFDFIFAILLGRLINGAFRTLLGGYSGQTGSPAPRPTQDHSISTARDPNCGMFVSTEVSRRLTRGSETLHFCSQECLDQYQKKLSA